MNNKSIESLIKACKKRNQLAQMQVYDLYSKAMYNVAYRYLKNEEIAKEAMQDAFLKVFVNIENYEESSTFGAWIKRIVINQCIDVLRKNELPTDYLESENFEIEASDSWDFDTQITKDYILKAIEKLNRKYKLIVQLYLLEGYNHVEISQILNIPVKTSRTHLHRAKLQLRGLLKHKYNETRY